MLTQIISGAACAVGLSIVLCGSAFGDVLDDQKTMPSRLPVAVAAHVKQPAELFDLADVKVTGGPFREAMETDLEYLLRLEPDRLLSWFRKESGLLPKGEVYRGWESQGVAGHSLGHYLSACAHMYRATGDARLLDRVNYIVDELSACQTANGNGYVGAIPDGKKVFAQLAEGDIRPQGGFTLNGGWVPWYTMHKVMAGLYDSADLCGSDKARVVLLQLTDWVADEVKNLDTEQMQKMLSVEQGGMAEVLANVYAFTAEAKYLALAERFRDNQIYQPMLDGKDILNGWHGNANIPKFIGYDRIYELTGDKPWGTAAKNFWTFVSRDRSFVTGGHGLYEHFFPVDKFENAMTSTNGPETCNTYNMLKLTTHLYGEDPQAAYMDFYERALYNHILPSQHPGTGGFVYYTPLSPGSYRTYSKDFSDFWCCVGTGMENHALYGQTIYSYAKSKGGDKLMVNLFIPSTLSWPEDSVQVVQETRFPDEPKTVLHFKMPAKKAFTVAVRYPAWVADGSLTIAVNGQPVTISDHPGDYAEVNREWNDGDTMEIALPMHLHTEMLPHSSSYVSILYGPMVLAGELGRSGLVDADFRNQLMSEQKTSPVKNTPAIVGDVKDIASHIEAVPGQPLVFRTHDLLKPADVTLAPLYQVYDQRWAVYWRTTTAKNWQADQAKWAAAEQHERALSARTIDHVRPGEQHPEVDHHFKGEHTFNGNFRDRSWRDAREGGFFSYDMKVDPTVANQLLCTYWGGDGGDRNFDILIDGTVVGTQTLSDNKPGEFFEMSYSLPADLIKGKSSVTVKFQAKPGAMAGGLFDCRMVK